MELKQVVWSYTDPKVSHDADRLSNGNTLIAFGSMDTTSDAQAIEVSPDGKIVWSWHAGDSFNAAPYFIHFQRGLDAYQCSITAGEWQHAQSACGILISSLKLIHRDTL